MDCAERLQAMLTPNHPLCTQLSLQNFPYYSRVRFNAARTGEAPGPYTYTIASGSEAVAFGYGIGGDMSIAGFPAGTLATYADTNIQERGKTIEAQDVLIKGLAIMLGQRSDARLAAALANSVSVKTSLAGGQTNAFMGIIEFWPGSGGFYGAGNDLTVGEGLNGERRYKPFVSNGFPGVDNYGPFPPQFVWQHSGQVDSQLNVVFRAERDIVLSASDVTGDNAFDSVATGTADFTAPSDGALFVDLMVRLHNEILSPRSNYI